jgi:2-C-methyl-D-erythritol 4-phosphate cytidylyltransferase
MGLPTPKQFVVHDGCELIEFPIETFNCHPNIDEVAVVVHPDWRSHMQDIVSRNHWDKLTKIIDGGSERYMSSLNAIMAYIDYPDDTNMLFHDAARPMVSAAIINRVAEALKNHEAVGVAVPSTDTVWEVHTDITGDSLGRFVSRIPERRFMWRAQTPQAFRLPLIRDAYQRALQDPQFAATDDCGVVRRYMSGVKIAVVEGEEQNRKITFVEDLKN